MFCSNVFREKFSCILTHGMFCPDVFKAKFDRLLTHCMFCRLMLLKVKPKLSNYILFFEESKCSEILHLQILLCRFIVSVHWTTIRYANMGCKLFFCRRSKSLSLSHTHTHIHTHTYFFIRSMADSLTNEHRRRHIQYYTWPLRHQPTSALCSVRLTLYSRDRSVSLWGPCAKPSWVSDHQSRTEYQAQDVQHTFRWRHPQEGRIKYLSTTPER